jgi:hypothetical protein
MQYESHLLFTLCRNVIFHTFNEFSVLHINILNKLLFLYFLVNVVYIKEFKNEELIFTYYDKNYNKFSNHTYVFFIYIYVYIFICYFFVGSLFQTKVSHSCLRKKSQL